MSVYSVHSWSLVDMFCTCRHFGSHDHKKVELHTKKLAVGTELNSLSLAVTHMEADIVRLQNDITVLGTP